IRSAWRPEQEPSAFGLRHAQADDAVAIDTRGRDSFDRNRCLAERLYLVGKYKQGKFRYLMVGAQAVIAATHHDKDDCETRQPRRECSIRCLYLWFHRFLADSMSLPTFSAPQGVSTASCAALIRGTRN